MACTPVKRAEQPVRSTASYSAYLRAVGDRLSVAVGMGSVATPSRTVWLEVEEVKSSTCAQISGGAVGMGSVVV